MTATPPASAPSVLFVCVKNGGKSQMAAGLMRKVGGTVRVDSAGTEPGTAVNALSAQALLEVGVDITDQAPKELTDQLIADADLIVVLGRDAQVHPSDGTPVEMWDTDEPSERGIDGIERMRLVRDDIASRVATLSNRLTTTPRPFTTSL